MTDEIDDHDEGAERIGFVEFILSIATNAAVHLGTPANDEELGEGRVDLTLAAQHIDIIAMLEEKTRGNLTREEADLLGSLLYDLRIRYLEIEKATKTG